MKSLIALPVLALITIACGGDGSVRDYEGGSINDNRNVQIQSIIDTHRVSLTDKEKNLVDTELQKFLSEMKSKKEVPETCYNAIKAPMEALLTSTVVSNDDDIKTSKEEINKITSDVKLCGKIAEYNQATSNVGIQENIIVDPSGDGENIVEDDGSYPNGGGYPDGGGYPTGGVGGGVVGGGAGGVVGGGVIGPDLLALGYWFGQNITNSIITIAEGVKYCDTAGILFGQSALAGTFTGPTLVNGILDSLGWYFFHVERLRPPPADLTSLLPARGISRWWLPRRWLPRRWLP